MTRNVSADYFSLADLYLAYRKAKSEAFFDNMQPSAILFAEYEQNLKLNLRKLLTRLQGNQADWHQDVPAIGDYLYVPKSIDESEWKEVNGTHYRAVDPFDDWRQCFVASGSKKAKANYRLLIAPSVDYHIISAMWILKVGHRFEAKLDKNLSFANRLRRLSGKGQKDGQWSGALNLDSLGLFVPYFPAYRTWRERGLAAMSAAVTSGLSVTAVTMDLASFYHKTSPKFLLRPSFLSKIGVQLSQDDRLFTDQLINSIASWYRSTPDFANRPEGALPVGLSASKVISNVLLFQLDLEMKTGISPLYYGRYVDDIFLVIESPEEVDNGSDLMRWLASKVPSLRLKQKKGKPSFLRLDLPYANDSDLFFTAEKQKIFLLSSQHGLDLVNQISAQVRQQSSEYRLLPELPDSAGEMVVNALLATSDAALSADALRKADAVSIRRLGFALLLRDIESYSRDLSRDEWGHMRSEFFGLVQRFLLAPKGLFELSRYYPRVFVLMVANHEFEEAHQFVNLLQKCFDLLEATCNFGKKDRILFQSCRSYFCLTLQQAALKASTVREFDQWTKLGKLTKHVSQLVNNSSVPSTKKQLIRLSRMLLLADLGARSYKDYWYYDQSEDIKDARIPRSQSIQQVIRWLDIKKFRAFTQLKVPHWPALAFPTRPLSIQEIVLIAPKILEESESFRLAIRGLRGAGVMGPGLIGLKATETEKLFSIPTEAIQKVKIALTNVETTDAQFKAALKGNPDRSLERYRNLCCLINGVLKNSPNPDYLLFPELSIPRRWAFGFASRLAKQNISMIAGIEYFTEHKGVKTNSAMISLATRWPGYRSSLIFMQSKISPSHHEAKEFKSPNKFLTSGQTYNSVPILYKHGEFIFGVVICSDLTAVQLRSNFQGKVDALFVLEWNPDIETFGFLIESSAHDIHTYVAQVNNRKYGDSRLRAPRRLQHERDSVRVKGGQSDYFVIGEIDYLALRRFQKRNNMTNPKAPFKPVPAGFEMAPYRKKIRFK